MRKIKKEKGYTLIELLLALAIIMMLAVLVYFTYAKVAEGHKADRLVNEIESITAQMDNILVKYPHLMSPQSGSVNFTKLIDTTLSVDPYNPYGYITNYGGTLTVSLMGTQAPGSGWVYVPSVSIERNAFKPESCVKIGNALLRAVESQEGNVSSLNIYGQDIDIKSGTSKAQKEIINACAKTSKEDGDALYYY